jgi:hypothetical protein
MNLKRHAISAAIALLAFLVLTLMSASWGLPALIAAGMLALVLTLGYFHYRRRTARAAIEPVTPARDDRVIPQDVKIAVTLRDKGQCQLRFADICLVDKDIQFDHRIPWSKGGSSKDPDNIQCACGPCNRAKSNKMIPA